MEKHTLAIFLLLTASTTMAGEWTREILLEKFQNACSTGELAGTNDLFYSDGEDFGPISISECGHYYLKPKSRVLNGITLQVHVEDEPDSNGEPYAEIKVLGFDGEHKNNEPEYYFSIIKIEGKYYMHKPPACLE